MITCQKLGAIALASTCLAPLSAFGQAMPPTAYQGTLISGDIGFGAGGVFGTHTGEAGRYTGLNVGGADFFGNFHINAGDAWDSGGTRYYQLEGDRLIYQTGTDLGALGGKDRTWLNSINNQLANDGSLRVNVGDQGTWGVSVHFNSITYTGDGIDSIYKVVGGQAFLNPGLLPFGGSTGAGPGPITAFTVPSLRATGGEQGVQTGTRRNIFGLEGHYIWGDWTFTGAFRHEHKEGSLEQAFDGTWGGTAFAKPIDFDTDRYDATAEYTNRLWQGIFQYSYSRFTDNINFVALPFAVSGTAAPFQRQAAFSQPPSNEAHYVTVELGSSHLIPLTRVNLNMRLGLEKQDDNFPPNTADPNPASMPGFIGVNSALQGTSANQLDALAKVYQLKLSADSRPFQNAEARVYYGLDGRNVSINQFKVTTGATGGAGTDSSLVGVQFAVPQDWFKQNAGADLSYRLIPEYDTKLTVGYRFDAVGRSNAQVGHSYTNTANVALLSRLGDQVDGKISFEYADRSGVLSYLTPWLNLNGDVNTATYSGAYYQAPMTSEAVKLRADYNPMPTLGGGLYVEFKNENFHYPAPTAANGVTPANPASFTGQGYGLKQDYALTAGPDINIRPTPATNLHFFYTYELLFFDNLGNGACQILPLSAACTGSAGFFRNKQTIGTHTIGANAEWKVTDQLKLKADYTFSYGSSMFSQFDGVFVPPALVTQSFQNVSNYPDIHSTLNNFSASAIYKLTPSIELGLEGFIVSFHNNDWNDTANAVQGAGGSAISILSPGYFAPKYTEVGIIGGVVFKLGRNAPPPPPTARAETPPVTPARTYLVFFDWDKADLTDRARQIIADAAQASSHVETTKIEVDGHADRSGTPQYNQALSLRRAQAVGSELVKDGVPQNIITIQAFGDTKPLVPTAAGVREPQNRRVEIVLK